MTPSSRHRMFIWSPNLERICIRANLLSLVQDHPTLHIVLEAAISVSCFYSTGQTRPCTLWIFRYFASITFTVIQNIVPLWWDLNLPDLMSTSQPQWNVFQEKAAFKNIAPVTLFTSKASQRWKDISEVLVSWWTPLPSNSRICQWVSDHIISMSLQ